MIYLGRVAGSLCVAVLIAACASQGTQERLSPSQVLANGVRAYENLMSTHVTANFTIDQMSGSAGASVLHSGDLTGSVTLGSETSVFVDVAGQSYFQTNAVFVINPASDIYTLASSLRGRPWWRTSGTPPVAAVVQLLSNGLVSTFLTGRDHLVQTAGKDSRGRSATRLNDSAGTVYVASESPYEILEVKSAPHYLVGGFSDVDLVFDQFNSPVSVAAPTNAVSPDAADMPLYAVIRSVDFGACDAPGCQVKAVVGAKVGSGMTTVTLTISASSDGARLATCTASVTLANYADSQTATCYASGTDWTNYWNKGSGSYRLQADVANPAYYH